MNAKKSIRRFPCTGRGCSFRRWQRWHPVSGADRVDRPGHSECRHLFPVHLPPCGSLSSGVGAALPCLAGAGLAYPLCSAGNAAVSPAGLSAPRRSISTPFSCGVSPSFRGTWRRCPRRRAWPPLPASISRPAWSYPLLLSGAGADGRLLLPLPRDGRN